MRTPDTWIRWSAVLTVCTIVALGVSGCDRGASSDDEAAAAPERDPGLVAAETVSTESQLRVVEQAVELYFVSNNRVPDSLEALVDEGFVQRLPVDAWNQPLNLSVDGPRGVTLSSAGPDATPDTDDDVIRTLNF